MITLETDQLEYLASSKDERLSLYNAAGIAQRGRYLAAEINVAHAQDEAIKREADHVDVMPTGATVRELAAFADTEIHELRAFADDMLDGLGDDDPMTSETERTLREALAQQAALGESFVPDPSLVFEIKVVDRLAPAAAPVVAALDRLATRAAMAAARAALVKAVMFEEVYSRLPLADAETLAHAEAEQRWYDALALGFAPIRSDRQIAL